MTIPLLSPYRTDDARQLAEQLSQHERSVRDELTRVGDGRLDVVAKPGSGEYAASVGELVVVTSAGPSGVVLPEATKSNAGLSVVIVRESGNYDLRARGGSLVEGAASQSAVTTSVRMTSTGSAWWAV